MVSRELLSTYLVRRSKQQKTAFIDFLQQQYPALQIQSDEKQKHRNLVLGDPEKAELILSAHYDTCAGRPLPNLILPQKRWLWYVYNFLPVVLLVGLMLLVNFWMERAGYELQYRMLGMLAAYYIPYILLFMGTRPNRHNANDNTSGVVTVLGIYDHLTPAEREKVCIILFDNEEYGCKGSDWFYRQHKQAMEEKLLINFDCVSEGDHILVTATPNVLEAQEPHIRASFAPVDGKTLTIGNLKKMKTSSDHKHFPRAMAVYAMQKNRLLGLYTDKIHTARDRVFQEENINFLKDAVLKFIRT